MNYRSWHYFEEEYGVYLRINNTLHSDGIRMRSLNNKYIHTMSELFVEWYLFSCGDESKTVDAFLTDSSLDKYITTDDFYDILAGKALPANELAELIRIINPFKITRPRMGALLRRNFKYPRIIHKDVYSEVTSAACAYKDDLKKQKAIRTLKWHRDNKDHILAYHKNRYETEPDFRDRAKSRAREQRARIKECPDKDKANKVYKANWAKWKRDGQSPTAEFINLLNRRAKKRAKKLNIPHVPILLKDIKVR